MAPNQYTNSTLEIFSLGRFNSLEIMRVTQPIELGKSQLINEHCTKPLRFIKSNPLDIINHFQFSSILIGRLRNPIRRLWFTDNNFDNDIIYIRKLVVVELGLQQDVIRLGLTFLALGPIIISVCHWKNFRVLMASKFVWFEVIIGNQ